MVKPRDPDLAVPDFEDQLERDLNRFVRQVLSDLSTEENSPVDTGFFASSWTASTQRPRPDQPREAHTPWSNIKPTKKGRPAAGSTINPRFIDNIKYNFKPFSTVFIGNRAKYAAFALEEGKVQSYVQGALGNKVKEIFREKPKVQVATKGYKGGKGIGQFADPNRVFVDYTNPYEQ
jgi:hypothetical protein